MVVSGGKLEMVGTDMLVLRPASAIPAMLLISSRCLRRLMKVQRWKMKTSALTDLQKPVQAFGQGALMGTVPHQARKSMNLSSAFLVLDSMGEKALLQEEGMTRYETTRWVFEKLLCTSTFF